MALQQTHTPSIERLAALLAPAGLPISAPKNIISRG
jgi:hypothetical protein